jgi:hypothetical protein
MHYIDCLTWPSKDTYTLPAAQRNENFDNPESQKIQWNRMKLDMRTVSVI